MTSITGYLYVESTSDWWIPCTKYNYAECVSRSLCHRLNPPFHYTDSLLSSRGPHEITSLKYFWSVYFLISFTALVILRVLHLYICMNNLQYLPNRNHIVLLWHKTDPVVLINWYEARQWMSWSCRLRFLSKGLYVKTYYKHIQMQLNLGIQNAGIEIKWQIKTSSVSLQIFALPKSTNNHIVVISNVQI